jgi:ureidoglycolate lyase
MLKIIKVKAEPLTPEAFAPFGDVIASFEEGRPEIRKGGLQEKEIRVSAEQNRATHFAYHTDAGQAFYPSTHRPTVFMVGPVQERLRPEDVRAFYSDGSLGICVRVGVWHTVPICLEGSEVYQSVRGDQDYVAHSVEIDFDQEEGVAFESA